MSLIYFIFLIFIWLHQVLVIACGIYLPDQGSNPGSLHWECGVLATGPLGKSLIYFSGLTFPEPKEWAFIIIIIVSILLGRVAAFTSLWPEVLKDFHA